MSHFVLIICFMSNDNSAKQNKHLFVVIMSPCRSLGTYLLGYTLAAMKQSCSQLQEINVPEEQAFSLWMDLL